jgi:hypothetical protein
LMSETIDMLHVHICCEALLDVRCTFAPMTNTMGNAVSKLRQTVSEHGLSLSICRT